MSELQSRIGTAAGLPVATFGAIVGDIYQCVLDPASWPGLLARICAAVGGPAGSIGVFHLGELRSVIEAETGTDPEWQRRLHEDYAAIGPFVAAPLHFQEGDILSVGDVIDYDEFVQGRFYKEWVAPQGWSDSILSILVKGPDHLAFLGVSLAERATPEHKARVAAFVPHLARAIRISHLLGFTAAKAADLEAAVAGLSTGMILVDAELDVRGINPAAERLIREVGGLSIQNKRLRVPGSDAGAQLCAAVSAGAGGRLEGAGATILFDAASGTLGLLVHVMPLAKPHARSREQAVAAIFLKNPASYRPPPIEAFVQRFALIPSETRVLLAIMDGKSPRAIATAQGIGMPTVRTHLHRLYDKTGTSGQADIVRLMAGLNRSL